MEVYRKERPYCTSTIVTLDVLRELMASETKILVAAS
jgi:hypothetical protein